MAERNDVFKCEICGNVIEVVKGGAGELVCCGQPMKKRNAQTADFATEKHVPVVEKTDKGFKVTVGSTLHPMEENHYIEWIQILFDGKMCRKFFKPGQEPVAEFETEAEKIIAREYCNMHGLWKSE